MLTVITGNVRTGKTLLAIILATISERAIVSNIQLKEKFPKAWCELDIAMLFRNEYTNSFILIDEAWSYFNARRSQTSENIAFSGMLNQSGKGNNHLVLTMQRLNSIDVAFRDLITEHIHVERNSKWIRYILWQAEKPDSTVEKYMDLEKCGNYFSMYDTKEIVEFGIKEQATIMFEKEERFEARLHELAEIFYRWAVENERPINSVGCQMWCLRSRIPHSFRPEIIFQAKLIEKANQKESPKKPKKSRKKAT